MDEVGVLDMHSPGEVLGWDCYYSHWNWPLHGVRRCLCQVVKAFDLVLLICTSSWCSQQRQDVVYANHSLAARGLHGDDWYWW